MNAEKLRKELMRLCQLQDSVTHYNERGADCKQQTLQAVRTRNAHIDRIVREYANQPPPRPTDDVPVTP